MLVNTDRIPKCLFLESQNQLFSKYNGFSYFGNAQAKYCLVLNQNESIFFYSKEE
jgi:hypothetical protein